MKQFNHTIRLMIILAVVQLVIFKPLFSQTKLKPGDLGMLTVNADGDKNFDFIAFVDLEAGTVIKFTDNAWTGTELKTNEGTITYTASQLVAKGTVISYSGSDEGDFSSTGKKKFLPSGSGDNILVYQGDESAPNFIYGIGWAKSADFSSGWISEGKLNTNNSYIPENLSEEAKTVVYLGNKDNYQYEISNGTEATPNGFLTLLANGENFEANNSTAYPALSASFTILEAGKPMLEIVSVEPEDSEINQAETKAPVYALKMNVSEADVNLTSLSFSTSGTYSETDVKKFSLFLSDNDQLSDEDKILAEISSNLASGKHTFTIANEKLSANSQVHLFITLDANASATIGNTISVEPFSDADFSFAEDTKLTVNTTKGKVFTFAEFKNFDSDIIANPSFSYTSDIDYQNFVSENLFDLCEFILRDGGENDDQDEKPTIVNVLKFEVENYENINSLAIYSGNTEIAKTEVEAKEINFTELNLKAEDNSQTNFTIKVGFKNKVTDNQQINIRIVQAETTGESSGFKNAGAGGAASETSGNKNRIEVTANQIVFIQQPTNVGLNSAISPAVKIGGVDANQNLDLDFDKSISISAEGLNNSPVAGNVNNGVAVFETLSFSKKAQNITLEAKTNDEAFSVVSNSFSVVNLENVFVENFESGFTNNWKHTEAWTVDKEKSISGTGSLRHNNSGSGIDYISYDLGAINLASGIYVWQFNLKNGNWSPSSSNKFWFFLASNQEDLANQASGYAVGINYAGSSKLLSLWKIENGALASTLIESELVWNAEKLIGVQITRENDGTWFLKYDEDGGFDNLTNGGSAKDSEYTSANFSGLVFSYTSSRAGELWLDDFQLFYENMPPVATSVEYVDNGLKVVFSENINKTSAETVSNYSINKSVVINSATVDSENPNVVLLDISEMEIGTYTIEIENITDLDGLAMNRQRFEFSHIPPAKAGDVVINEIMTDVNPAPIGLPAVDYIELYNVQNYPIDLNNWKLTVGTKEMKINDVSIDAKGYLIITTESGKSELETFGQIIALIGSTDLTNAGKEIKLQNEKGENISVVTYSDAWYYDSEKKKGGWSLEKIDPERNCADYSNWTASTEINGGTPGQRNSVFASNKDNTSPELIALGIISSNEIKLTFSEPINAGLLENKIFTINNEQNPTSFSLNSDNTEIELTFTQHFSEGEENLLTIQQIVDECDNVSNTISRSFTYFVAGENDIVINEIMIDPTPVVGLPEVEYIELFNTTEFPVDITDWTIKVGKTEKVLPSLSIDAKGYLLITSNAGVPELKKYGKTIGLLSSSALTNSGNQIVLRDKNGQMINQIAYTSSWYYDSEKDNGGWSIEKIDANRNCGAQYNWKASVNEKGGTPGEKNSVAEENQDNTKPEILHVNIVNANTLQITFSEVTDESDRTNPDNYAVDNEIGKPKTIFSYEGFPETVYLTFQTNFVFDLSYNITVEGIRDLCGNEMDKANFKATYYAIHQFDVVINEIMEDESPTIHLPKYEYIELYNRTEHDIDLSNWTLETSGKKISLPSASISSKGYLILCKSKAVSEFEKYGQTLGLDDFVSLKNSSGTLILRDLNDKLISLIEYSELWHTDSYKAEGGWSLERIDANNPQSTSENWVSSNDPNGGTPGKQNSVAAENPDLIVPKLSRAVFLSESSILLYFTESVKGSDLSEVLTYTIDNQIGNPVSVAVVAPYDNSVQLFFNTKFEENILYTISVSGEITDWSGNIYQTGGTVLCAIPHTPQSQDIVINEVLFNPKSGGVDYVEIYNRSKGVIDLSDVRLASKDETGKIKTVETITSVSYLFFPEQYLVLTKNPEIVKSHYSTENPDNFLAMKSLPSFPDKKGRVVLIDISENTIDDFAYTDDMHHKLLSDKNGVSLERVNFNRPTNELSNWHSASEASGYGTPGYKNSQYNDATASGSNFTIVNEMFSPDNDGYQDQLLISYKYDQPGYTANLKIYDSNGVLVKHLINNELLGTEGMFAWDGIDDNNEKAKIGIYIIYFEIFDLKGNVEKTKKICVVAGKLD